MDYLYRLERGNQAITDRFDTLQSWYKDRKDRISDLKCLRALYFPTIDNRVDAVSRAYEKTFSWILESPPKYSHTNFDLTKIYFRS